MRHRERERERESGRDVHMYIYILCMYASVDGCCRGLKNERRSHASLNNTAKAQE